LAEDGSENLANAHHFLHHAHETSARGQGSGQPDVQTSAIVGVGYALLALVDEIDELRKQLREKQ
jgi:hypothetical protein